MPAPESMHAAHEEAFNRRLGKILERLRLEAGLKQTELGDCIGVSGQQISKYESGENRIPAARLGLCAEALRVPITLFYANQPMTPLERECARLPSRKVQASFLLMARSINDAMARSSASGCVEEGAPPETPTQHVYHGGGAGDEAA